MNSAKSDKSAAGNDKSAKSGGELLSVDDARAQILDRLRPLGDEMAFLPAAAGRVLSGELRSLRDLPAFDNSAMDGVGVRAADLAGARSKPVRLTLTGASLPGGAPVEAALKAGQAVRIMTGAPVPPGVDAVVMRELTDESEVQAGIVVVKDEPPVGQHIRRRGEDVARDDVVGSAGDVITPARLNLLLSAGHATARVHRRPVVAVVASGDELREVGLPLGERDVVNSNAHAIAGAAREAGCDVHVLGIARDSLEDHVRRMKDGLFADVLITIGGVSMGTHDFVRPALEQIGATLDMWRVAMKPGKPVAFGHRSRGEGNDVVIFGLPGNPVSSLVSFELFVRPALRKMSGARAVTRPLWKATLVDSDFKKKPGLEHWARGEVRLTDGALRVRLAGQQGSHQISAMARGNALVRFGRDVERVNEGAIVDLMLLDDPFTDADRV